MKVKSALLFLLLFCNKAMAAISCPASHSFCEIYGTEISSVYINEAGTALIGVPDQNGWLTIGNVNSSETAKVMYSTALAIKASGYKRAWVRWNESDKKVMIVSYDWK
ncbi:hypothetical protein [Pseudoalteromonas umbrosa]|uniref:hypothetical protein n=1 Tax=Pseudoalteromonas umbrosa TaxID=3048489 RepID=UPI0024C38450|nr:hypothetical protein [Pseudoalteromonas sp. B95]MDK1286850.1 hypothetical protein [Pseudoalteromonas sp. B95]